MTWQVAGLAPTRAPPPIRTTPCHYISGNAAPSSDDGAVAVRAGRGGRMKCSGTGLGLGVDGPLWVPGAGLHFGLIR
jgi:hypothetical protein